MHRFRPKFLATSSGLPPYTPYEHKHTCLLTVESNEDSDNFAIEDDISTTIHETKKCIALPFVDAHGFNKKGVSFTLANSIKEVFFFFF